MDKYLIDYNQLKTLDPAVISLYHQESSKRLDDLKRIETVITERAYKLFGIYYTVEIAIIGYVLAQLDHSSMGLINASIAIIIFTAISIYYVIVVMRPHDVMPAGRSPKNFNIEKNYKTFESNRALDKYAYTMTGELMNMQEKIDKQEDMNKARTKQTNSSINFMIIGLVLAVMIFLISVILA